MVGKGWVGGGEGFFYRTSYLSVSPIYLFFFPLLDRILFFSFQLELEVDGLALV